MWTGGWSNATPLVDILLLLLIIFMVTAQLQNTKSVPLDLPRSEHIVGVEQSIFSVLLRGDGTLDRVIHVLDLLKHAGVTKIAFGR